METAATQNYLNSHTSEKWNQGFMSWFMSTDHKRIGVMYGVTMFSFFFLGCFAWVYNKTPKFIRVQRLGNNFYQNYMVVILPCMLSS